MTDQDEAADMRGKAKILIVDDHPVVREGLIRRINRQPDLVVCGEAGAAAEALKAIAGCRPDLVIVDLTLQDKGGLELIKDLQTRYPKLRVLVLSMHDEKLYAERALRAGAMGYVMKQEATEHVIEAIRRVLGGQVYLSESMAARLLGTFVAGKPADAASPIESLSDRELEVFELVGRGLATGQIAGQLHVSVKTVEAYKGRLKAKLKLESAIELTQQAALWVQKQAKT
jgi:DNA-binding NarL/FixJ family response regulator